ncbi:unnamed protein product [Paramecium sonneborni]|uniref:Uncharacterized protein n=1 Tax=Paramecium sonneborni TaxID=65129 RepID=A0A8S1PHJ0_9CILI|nr:unnamed protein product [Paramecium sonneborni]
MQQKQVIITIQSGCGLYDEQNLQNGKWIELSDNFAYESEVIFIGNYQKGKKISKWDIQFRYYDNFQSIGGGSYNEDNLKDGEWIELSDNFHNFSQVLWHGKYNIGQKVDRWNCFYEGELIGSGFYDDLNLKNGKWIEPSDNFQYYRQIKFEGWYKNGKKIGKWDLYWQGEGKNQDFELIGGGYYNEQSIKIGIWIEISDDFQKLKQVVYKGEYQNGKKVQIWKIQWRDQTQNQFIAIGGGQYNKKGMKIGKWIELSDQFQIGSRIFFLGQYKNCLKVGNWEIHYQDFEDNYQLIGGGFYDDETNLKNGIWIEQDDNFWNGNYQIWIGKYKNAQKIGDWIKMKRNESIKNQDFQRVQYICNSSGEYQFNI